MQKLRPDKRSDRKSIGKKPQVCVSLSTQFCHAQMFQTPGKSQGCMVGPGDKYRNVRNLQITRMTAIVRRLASCGFSRVQMGMKCFMNESSKPENRPQGIVWNGSLKMQPELLVNSDSLSQQCSGHHATRTPASSGKCSSATGAMTTRERLSMPLLKLRQPCAAMFHAWSVVPTTMVRGQIAKTGRMSRQKQHRRLKWSP